VFEAAPILSDCRSAIRSASLASPPPQINLYFVMAGFAAIAD
jgi:hypothetical protein